MEEHTLVEPFVHSIQHSCEVDGEKSWGQYTPLLHAIVDPPTETCLNSIVELLDDINELVRASIGFKDLLEGCMVDDVKCL